MLEVLTEEEQNIRDAELENSSQSTKTKKVKNPYKCQIQGTESYIDNQFVIFSQSYLINSIISFNKGKTFPEFKIPEDKGILISTDKGVGALPLISPFAE